MGAFPFAAQHAQQIPVPSSCAERSRFRTAPGGRRQMANDQSHQRSFPGERRDRRPPCRRASNGRWRSRHTLNRLTYDDADQVRALFSRSDRQGGGRRLFADTAILHGMRGQHPCPGAMSSSIKNCTFYDLGGLDIADDVLIGPNVSLITSGHPVEPAQRRAGVTAKPIVIERNVWIATGAIVIGGVTVGANSVVAAGSVVTKDIPAQYHCRRGTPRGSFVRSPSEKRLPWAGFGRQRRAVLRRRSTRPAGVLAQPAGESPWEIILARLDRRHGAVLLQRRVRNRI